jgi:hypothetical protein
MAIDLGASPRDSRRTKSCAYREGPPLFRWAIIEPGRHILAYGTKKGGDPWRIGVQDPTGQPRGADRRRFGEEQDTW